MYASYTRSGSSEWGVPDEVPDQVDTAVVTPDSVPLITLPRQVIGGELIDRAGKEGREEDLL